MQKKKKNINEKNAKNKKCVLKGILEDKLHKKLLNVKNKKEFLKKI